MATAYQSLHFLRRANKRILVFVVAGVFVFMGLRAAGYFAASTVQWSPSVQTMLASAHQARGVLNVLLVALIVGLGVILLSDRALAQVIHPQNLQPMLDRARSDYKLPAVGGALITSAGLQSMAVAGARKRGEEVAVTQDDLWHLGSNGKAITAVMMGRLVERGVMRWNQTLAETFPDLADEMSEPMRAVTLEQLLSHRAGLQANFDVARYVARTDLTAARLDVLKDAMKIRASHRPGERFVYSNWGYTIASAMAERATGKAFETLMREEVFVPLAITSAGFQGTGTPGKIDQPWPHAANGRPARSNGPEMDNVPTMAAAGTMHMSLRDYGVFIAELLKAAQGKSTWLKHETVETMLRSRGDDYALGWLVPERKWAGGRAIHHGGDNTFNTALIWGSPRKDYAVVFVANQSQAHRAGDDFVSEVIRAIEARQQAQSSK